VQRAAAEGYNGPLWSIGARPKWQTEAHEKTSNKLRRGVYRMPKVWY